MRLIRGWHFGGCCNPDTFVRRKTILNKQTFSFVLSFFYSVLRGKGFQLAGIKTVLLISVEFCWLTGFKAENPIQNLNLSCLLGLELFVFCVLGFFFLYGKGKQICLFWRKQKNHKNNKSSAVFSPIIYITGVLSYNYFTSNMPKNPEHHILEIPLHLWSTGVGTSYYNLRYIWEVKLEWHISEGSTSLQSACLEI